MNNALTFSEFIGMNPLTMILLFLIFLALYLFINWLCYYKIFKKMGYSGWECFIPYYNTYCFYKGIHNPIWLFIIYLCISLIGTIYNMNQIPKELTAALAIVSCLIYFITVLNISKAFDVDIFSIVLLVFLPFIGLPIVGFGSSHYLYDKIKRNK